MKYLQVKISLNKSLDEESEPNCRVEITINNIYVLAKKHGGTIYPGLWCLSIKDTIIYLFNK